MRDPKVIATGHTPDGRPLRLVVDAHKSKVSENRWGELEVQEVSAEFRSKDSLGEPVWVKVNMASGRPVVVDVMMMLVSELFSERTKGGVEE